MARMRLTSKVIKVCEGAINEVATPCFVQSARTFVTASRSLKKDNKPDEKVEETCDQVSEAAEAVKKGAAQVTNMTKDVRGKVNEATDSITKKAKDDVVDVAGKKLKQTVVDDDK